MSAALLTDEAVEWARAHFSLRDGDPDRTIILAFLHFYATEGREALVDELTRRVCRHVVVPPDDRRVAEAIVTALVGERP